MALCIDTNTITGVFTSAAFDIPKASWETSPNRKPLQAEQVLKQTADWTASR